MEKVAYRFFPWRFALIAVVSVLFVSCGFEPAWKSADTVVSFRMGPAARAVASGGGYLYVRPLGGPLGTGPKPYIGPIKLSSGDVYTTTEIEPGSYDGFVLIYSPYVIDNVSYANGLVVREVFSGSDVDFNFAVFNPDRIPAFTQDVVQNAGAYVNTGPITVAKSEVTEIKATLLPMTRLVYHVDNPTLQSFGSTDGPYQRFRYFVQIMYIRNSFDGTDQQGVFFSVAANDLGETITPSAVQLYQENGKPWTTILQEQVVAESVYTDGCFNTQLNPVTPDTLYLYVDVVANYWRVGVDIKNLLW